VNDAASPEISELGPVIGQVQTDTFCEGCGYNLHTQAVVRDQRLGILVSRCPECGRFAASGRTTSASSVWLNRFGTILLVVWVVFLLGLFSLCSLFLGMVAYGHPSILTTYEAAPYVRVRLNTSMPTAIQQASYPYRYVRIPRQTNSGNAESDHRELQGRLILASIAAALALITGGLFSILLWHCKGWGRLFALLPPILGCIGAALAWISDPTTILIREWGIVQIGLYLLIEIPGVAIGAWIGRPIARLLLKILVPPKARQHLAFLWIVDGKERLPAMNLHH
jgi:hypothetical protein